MPFYTQIHMLVVHEAVPARNAAELVVLARALLGKLTFGSAGGGSPSRIADRSGLHCFGEPPRQIGGQISNADGSEARGRSLDGPRYSNTLPKRPLPPNVSMCVATLGGHSAL
jgi:hypothetical protein